MLSGMTARTVVSDVHSVLLHFRPEGTRLATAPLLFYPRPRLGVARARIFTLSRYFVSLDLRVRINWDR